MLSGTHSQADEGLSDSELFTMLGNDRRRETIEYVATDGEVTVSDVAEHIAERTDGDGAYRSVYVSLLQNHLPKLAETGILDYDSGDGTVAPGPNFGVATARLEQGESTAAGDWVPVGLAVLGVAGVGAEIAGVSPFSTTLDGWWALAVLVLILAYLVFDPR